MIVAVREKMNILAPSQTRVVPNLGEYSTFSKRRIIFTTPLPPTKCFYFAGSLETQNLSLFKSTENSSLKSLRMLLSQNDHNVSQALILPPLSSSRKISHKEKFYLQLSDLGKRWVRHVELAIILKRIPQRQYSLRYRVFW